MEGVCFLPKRMKFYEVIESRGRKRKRGTRGKKVRPQIPHKKMKIYVYALVGNYLLNNF